jgi:hypothetical protein
MSLLIHVRDPMTTIVTFCVRFSGTNVINCDNLQRLRPQASKFKLPGLKPGATTEPNPLIYYRRQPGSVRFSPPSLLPPANCRPLVCRHA